MGREWLAKECEIKVKAASDVTLDLTSTIASKFTSGSTVLSTIAKDVTVTPSEGAVDQTNYMGKDANDFQNATLTEKPFGMAKVSMSLTQDAISQILTKFAGTGTTITGGYKRFQIGKATARVPVAILINMSDADEYVAILLHNALISKMGDRKQGGADGVWEFEVEANCLPKDYYEEYKE